LYVLQKKGPEAFQCLLESLKKANKYLAEILQNQYEEELQKLRQAGK